MAEPSSRKLKKLLFRLAHIGLGLATHVPKYGQKVVRGTGGTDSARYCYSVWMRHVVKAHEAGVWNAPRCVAELGPGDSLGIGLAALLTGVERYLAFDVVQHASNRRNLEVFDQLVELVRARADIPDEEEFPVVKPYLDEYDFPAEVFTDDQINRSIAPERLVRIRQAIESLGMGENDRDDSPIRYVVPWADVKNLRIDDNAVQKRHIDMIYSQAVLEHVDELDQAYAAMKNWLHKDGFISHQIDFKCHGTALDWDGHWAISDRVWKIMRGRRPYLINRRSCSAHLKYLETNDFHVKIQNPIYTDPTVTRSQLAVGFRGLSDSDLRTSGVYLLAVPSE